CNRYGASGHRERIKLGRSRGNILSERDVLHGCTQNISSRFIRNIPVSKRIQGLAAVIRIGQARTTYDDPRWNTINTTHGGITNGISSQVVLHSLSIVPHLIDYIAAPVLVIRTPG